MLGFRPLIISLFVALFSPVILADSVTVNVLDATIKDKRISGAEVVLQKNGEQSIVGNTDAQGNVTLNSPFSATGDSLLIIKKSGFSDLVVKCPCNGLTYAMSPVMQNLDGMRIVLSWGEKPEDLDSHLVYSGNHIFFEDKQGDDAELDVDDTDSYGPETITIQKKQFGQSYVYAVHDFTNRSDSGSSALSASKAKVFVYVGQSLVRTYDVPVSHTGNLWTVFRLNPNGDFEDINTLTSLSSDGSDRPSVGPALTPLLNDSSTATPMSAQPINSSAARALNASGEAAYHANKLADAVSLYQQAIEQDGTYSQAYSNLGLAYQKQNRVAEAIWASRKAIALANGNNANTVKAASYFNIARIYEQSGNNAEALRHFKLAKQQKDNPAYDKAIKRMQDKL